MTDTAEDAGDAPHVLHALETPQYAAIIEYVFVTLGWDDFDRFGLLRCRTEYPLETTQRCRRTEIRGRVDSQRHIAE